MSAASDYLENKLLDHVLGGTAFSQPASRYVALFTSSTGLESNSPTGEVSTSGTGYARQAITFSAASGGAASNSALITFPTATGTWGTVTHIAIMDASTSGNVLFWGAVTTSKTITSGDIFAIASTNLAISLA